MADYPINYHVLSEDFKTKGNGTEPFTQDDAKWLLDSLHTMCNAYDELIDKETDMKTLNTVPQPAPESHPDMDMQGAVACTATVFPKKGHEFWVCNPMDELIEAMTTGDRFVAHKIIAMAPKRVILDPQDIARIEEA